jgi:hypothetical protein
MFDFNTNQKIIQAKLRIIMKDMYKYGVGFWIGAMVYSLINMIMNLKNAPQSNILFYNYLIIGVAVIGLILNIILLKRAKS